MSKTFANFCTLRIQAGLGRGKKDFILPAISANFHAQTGATGFTTRSDLGPTRSGPSEDQIKQELQRRAEALNQAPPTAYGVSKKKPDEDAEEDQFQDAENEEGLFATGNYDRDDDEADRIYQTVDERMDKRRKSRRLVDPCFCTSMPPTPFGKQNYHVHHFHSEYMPTLPG